MDKNKLLDVALDASIEREIHSVVTEDMAIDPMSMLRRLHGIKIERVEAGLTSDGQHYLYQIWGVLGDRREVGTAAADLTGLGGTAWGDAIKSVETQAKRRLTTSLVGYGFKAPEGERVVATEPAKPEQPAVNHAPAFVETANVPETVTVPPAPVPHIQTTPFPQVTEQTLADMHNSAQTFDKQASDPTLPKEKPPQPEPPIDIFGSIETEAFESTIPKDVPATPSTTEVSQSLPSSVQLQATEATTPEPEPVKDLEIAPAASEKPTRLQFQEFTARCTKLCRDVLPKAGKEVAQLLLPYLRKIFNVQDLSQATCLQWESTLARLEGAKTPAEAAAIIKSGK